jgi:hypothetical protein
LSYSVARSSTETGVAISWPRSAKRGRRKHVIRGAEHERRALRERHQNARSRTQGKAAALLHRASLAHASSRWRAVNVPGCAPPASWYCQVVSRSRRPGHPQCARRACAACCGKSGRLGRDAYRRERDAERGRHDSEEAPAALADDPAA